MSDESRIIEAQQIRTTESSGKSFESAIIPKSFWLGGLQIDVRFDENLYKNKNVVGEAGYTSQSISLDSSILKKQSTEQTYYHELTHWILYMMNEDALRTNEKFVDLFAHFLYQARMTEQRVAVVEQKTDEVASRVG